MTASTITVQLTVQQAEQLWAAGAYKADQGSDGDGLPPAKCRVLERGVAALDAALTAAGLPAETPYALPGPFRGYGVATVAQWLTEHNAEDGKPPVNPRDVTDWLHRYGPDRAPERLAVTPAYPEPDVEVEVDAGRVIKGWTLERRSDWERWYDGRPGRGAGGGRPRKEGTS